MKEQWMFIKATRFWAMALTAIALYLKTKGWVGEPEMILVSTITAGFIVVRSVDRFSEKIGKK